MQNISKVKIQEFPLAFIILAHNEFRQLASLVHYLATNQNDTVIIHIDKKVSDYQYHELLSNLKNKSNVIFSKRVIAKWGAFSLVEATIEAIKTLENSARDYQYISLLSGVDYPIKSTQDLRNFLSTDRKEYIECFNMYREKWIISGSYSERFEYSYPIARVGIGARIFMIIENIYQIFDYRQSMLKGFVPYSGSQWWTISAEAIKNIKPIINDPSFKKRFKKSFVPDEMFFQTAIMNSLSAKNVFFKNLRYIKWLDSGTPYSFKITDISDLKSTNAYFARKIINSYNPSLIKQIHAILIKK